MSGATSLPVRLESLFGADHVLTAETQLSKYAIDGMPPRAVLRPASAEEVAEIVKVAAREELAMIPCGSGSKLGIGMPPQRYDIALDMRGLQEIAHYDADDLTLSVDSGKLLGGVQMALRAKRQFLPLAVPCMEICTIGGTVASGIDSSLRQQYGTGRDFLIGAEFVDGTGRLCRSGGRVVKNVTGYDIHKLLIGSLGTLAVITRLNFRTFPLPEAHAGHLATFSSLDAALHYHAKVSQSGLPLSNLELFDSEYAAMAGRLFDAVNQNVSPLLKSNSWVVYSSCADNAIVVRRIVGDLERIASSTNCANQAALQEPANEELQGLSQTAYQLLSTAAPCVALLRIVLPQLHASTIAEILRTAETPWLHSAFVVRACNVAYLALLAEKEDEPTIAVLSRSVSSIFSAVSVAAGSAAVLHAPAALKRTMNLWGPSRPDFALMQRVKAAFDPQNIFAPGRFVGGI